MFISPSVQVRYKKQLPEQKITKISAILQIYAKKIGSYYKKSYLCQKKI